MDTRLQDIQAEPQPMGNRIGLRWTVREPHLWKGVRVIRRESTHPESPEENTWVGDFEIASFSLLMGPGAAGIIEQLDAGVFPAELAARLAARGTVFVSPRVTVRQPGGRWQVSAGGKAVVIVASAGALTIYECLYRAKDQGLQAETYYYYTLFPYKDEPAEYEFHFANRVSCMATGRYDFAGLLYRMLPAVYHRYDNAALGAGEDSGPLRRFLDIPGSHLDQFYSFASAVRDFHNPDRTDPHLLPLLGQWIGWKTDYTLSTAKQRNEIRCAVHLYHTAGIIPTVEATVKRIGGWESRTKEYLHNVILSNRPEQLNLHRLQREPNGTWLEEDEVFSLDFAYEGRPSTTLDAEGNRLLFYHTRRNNRWQVWYKTYKEKTGWGPSQPFVTGTGNNRRRAINKHPDAVLQGETTWVSWNGRGETGPGWEVYYKKQAGGAWSPVRSLADEGWASGNPRKSPRAVVDHENRLWLFWLEKEKSQWRLKFKRHDGTGWEPGPPADFPLFGGKDPRVEKDLSVVFWPWGARRYLWFSWSRKKELPGGKWGEWEIAHRLKRIMDNPAAGWYQVRVIPKVPAGFFYHDSEPGAVVNGAGRIELFWSSNRTGSWAIRNLTTFQLSPARIAAAQPLTDSPYSQRAPLPIRTGEEISVIYRSNKSISYRSGVYSATTTVDSRYSGGTTADVRDTVKAKRRGKYGDFLTYTYQTGAPGKPGNDDRYARDTAGIFPDTGDLSDEEIKSRVSRIKKVLKEFIPITIRTVFNTPKPVD